MATIFIYVWGVHWRHLGNTTEPLVYSGDAALFMVALCNRETIYIFMLFLLLLLSSFFSSPQGSHSPYILGTQLDPDI